jgi:hypothetical protein
MKTKVRSRVARNSLSSLRTRACTSTSSADVGSSSTTISDWQASARAIATRWRWPPDRAVGDRLAKSAGRPTSSRSAPTRSALSALAPMPCTSSASRSEAPIERLGLSDDNGFCCTSWMARRCSSLRRWGRAVPFSRISPDVGGYMPRIMLATVLLPDPDSPTIARHSPLCDGKRDRLRRVDRIRTGSEGLGDGIKFEDWSAHVVASASWISSGAPKSGEFSSMSGMPPPVSRGTAAIRARV